MSTKTNERPGTRAQVRYLRMSASKARVVLDLIRDKHVSEASQILAFSNRLASREIAKVLQSAVANAAHNDEIPVEELYVSACYADEGPTLKRFRPRARGRAGRIHKQTCHITVIVSRLTDEELDELRTRAESRGQSRSASADRAARVAKSRGAEADEAAETDASDAESTETEVVAEEVTEAVETEAVETEAADDAADDAEPEEAAAEESTAEEAAEEDEATEDDDGADA